MKWKITASVAVGKEGRRRKQRWRTGRRKRRRKKPQHGSFSYDGAGLRRVSVQGKELQGNHHDFNKMQSAKAFCCLLFTFPSQMNPCLQGT